MTEQDLQAIEARRVDLDEFAGAMGLDERLLHQDVPALIAEVRRLQGVIKQVEWAASYDMTSYCLWCNEAEEKGHAPTCPAFGSTL